MRAAAEWRTWWRHVDPLTPLVGFIALIVYSLHGFEGFLSRDLAVYGYGAQQAAEGVPPYVGVLTRAGPLAQMLPAVGVVGARVGGIDDLLGMRLLFMVIAVACVCLVYLLGRTLFASPLAGLTAATAFLTFYGFIEYASNGPREKTPMVLFLLCSLLAVAGQRWFVAGFCVSLATLVWQPAFFVGLAAMLVALIAVRASERIRALLRIALGGMVPLSAILLYFVVNGALREFIECFLILPARFTTATPLTDDLADSWTRLQNGYGVSLWVMLLGLGALGVLAFSALRRKHRRRDPAGISVAAVGAAGLTGVFWTVRAFNDWPDAFVLLPLAAVGVGGMAKRTVERLSLRSAVSLTLVWAVATVGVALTYSITARDHRLDLQRASVAAVLEQLPSDASILSIQAPEALVLSGQTNPTRYQMFTDGLSRYLDRIWPGGLTGFGTWISREQPTLITLANSEVPSWLRPTIKAGYRRVGRAPGWVWWVHRSVGRDVVAATRDANRAALDR